MTTTQIELNAPYRHKRTGGIYTTQAIAVMKSGEGQWQSCVVYNRAEDSATFVRDFEHFVQNFELVEGAPHDAAAAATAERAAFEAWAGPRWRSLERFAALDGSHYLQPELEREWLGWQARAALSAPVAAQPAQAQAAGVPDEMRAQGWSQADMSQQQFSKYGPQLRPDDLAGADEGRDEAVAKVRQMQQAMKSPLGHGAPDWNRANYKPLCEGGPLYVRGECGDCDSRAAVVFGGALLAVSGVDALWVEKAMELVDDFGAAVAELPKGAGAVAIARAEIRTHLSTALTGATPKE